MTGRNLFADESNQEEGRNLFADETAKDESDDKAIGGTGYKSFSHVVPELKNLAGGVLDEFSRAGTALGEAGQYIGNNPITRGLNRIIPDALKFVPQSARDVDIRSLTGADQGGQDILGDRTSGSYKVGNALGGIGAAIGTGGASIPGAAIGGGIVTGLTADPDQKLLSSHIPGIGQYAPQGRLPAAIEATLMGLLAPPAAKAGWNVASDVASKVPSKVPSAISSSIGKAADLIRPSKLADNIMNELSGGQTLEEHGKDFASNIKQSFEDQKQRISNRYDDFFDQNNLGKEEIYPEQLKYIAPNKVKSGDELTRNMPQFPSGLGSDEYENALDKFTKEPTIENGHELQSKLASEQRLLQRQYDSNILTGQDNTQTSRNLALTNKSRQQLLSKMHDTMDDVVSGSSDEYKSITADYLKNQVPYYGDKNLRSIITGKNANPTTGQFTSIFKNPDEGINTILGHLGPNSRNDALFQSLKLQPEDLTAQELMKNMKKTNREGFESYQSPELKNAVSKVALASKIKRYAPAAALTMLGGTNSALGYMIYRSLTKDK